MLIYSNDRFYERKKPSKISSKIRDVLSCRSDFQPLGGAVVLWCDAEVTQPVVPLLHHWMASSSPLTDLAQWFQMINDIVIMWNQSQGKFYFTFLIILLKLYWSRISFAGLQLVVQRLVWVATGAFTVVNYLKSSLTTAEMPLTGL